MSATPPSNTATLDGEGLRPGEDHIDVDHAEAQFDQLQRALSGPDYGGGTKTISSTPQQEKVLKDIEAASLTPTEEPFDLREYLTSSNDAMQASGIHHKHVGATWEDLEVSGIGGEDSKVRPSFQSRLSPSSDSFEQLYVPTFQGAIWGSISFPFVLLWWLLSRFLPEKYISKTPTRTIIHR